MMDYVAIYEFEVQRFETSSLQQKFLVCYRDRHFEVTAAVAELIYVLQQAGTMEEAAEQFSKNRNRKYSVDELEKIIERSIVPIIKSIERPQKKPFIVKFEIFSAQSVAIISRRLKALFNPVVGGILLATIIVAEIFFLLNANTRFEIGQLNLYTILGVLALFITSSSFHELGHAAACQQFGIAHGGVGFGLYLSFPVFYTDVSNVWRLPKNKRLVVNMAGTYFQLIFLVPLIIIYLYTYNNILKFFIMTVNVNLLITLNPFFKFDGYWMISDLLGVPNLRVRTNEFMAYVWKKIYRKTVGQKPFLTTLKSRYKVFMAVYSVIVNLFFAYFFGYALPMFFYQFFSIIPQSGKQLITLIASGSMPSFALIQSVLIPLLFFGFFVYMIVKTVRSLLQRMTLRRKIKQV